MIQFACPKCAALLKTSPDQAGRMVRCPKCQGIFPVSPKTYPIAPIETAVPDEPRIRVDVPDDNLSVPIISSSSQIADVSDDLAYEYERRRRNRMMLLVTVGIMVAIAVPLLAFVIVAVNSNPPQASIAKSESKREGDGRIRFVPPAQRPAEQLPVRNIPKTESPARSAPPSNQASTTPEPPIPQPTNPLIEPESKPPPLTATLMEPDAIARERMQLFAQRLKSKKAQDRINAITDIGNQGQEAKWASRALCDAMLDPVVQVRLAAATALERVNPVLHAVLIPLMVDKDLTVKAECIGKLERMGAEAAPAVAILIQMRSQISNGEVIVKTLGLIAPNDPVVVSNFAAWLSKDRNPNVRLEIAKALARNDGRKEALNALLLSLKTDPVDAVRAAAAMALTNYEAKDVLDALNRAKTDSSSAVRDAAARASEQVQR